MERALQIRSISRCIAVLQAINRHGSLSLMDIARESKLPYPTTCRIIQTLMHEGLIECEPARKFYRATGLVHSLSRGFRNEDALVTSARPLIVALTRKVGWPVAIATRVGHSMMIRDTTNDLTALTADLYPPGYTMPLLECAAGQVFFAHLDEEARRGFTAGHDAPLPSLSDENIARIRADGFLVHDRGAAVPEAGSTASISVPLHDDVDLVGALTLILFTSVMPIGDALSRYLPDLHSTAARIAEATRAFRGTPFDPRGMRTPGARRETSRVDGLTA